MVVEPKRVIGIFDSDYEALKAIANKNGFVYPEGHTHAGKMDSAQTVEYLVKNFSDKIA